MVVDTPSRSAAHWSDYWSSGALTSLPQDFAFNYDGEVQAFWQKQFEALPQEAAMLDICTGNGPIALLAAGWAEERQRELAITAVDAARIRPEAIGRRQPAVASLLASIRFLGETPVENLPFDDGAFDLVTSQYGLEYCRLDAAAREIARVLRPGGRLAMLTHEASSEVIATMTAEKRDYDALESVRFFRVLRSWVGGQLAEPDLLSRLKRIQPRLQEHFRRTRSPLLGQVMQSIGSLLTMSMADLRDNREAVRGFLGRMEAGRDRLEDMLRVNRRIKDDPDWHRPLAEAGLQCLDSHAMVYRGQHPMGQCLIWQRRP
jgi:ubiquinone/menaquinone biosynthesis C-methylase UbiE